MARKRFRASPRDAGREKGRVSMDATKINNIAVSWMEGYYGDEDLQNDNVWKNAFAAMKEICELSQDGGWTPCSVALPENQSDVLIYFDRCGGEVGIGYYAERADGVKFWCAMGSMLCYNVIAWQPLPEPYRGEA